MAYRQTEFGKGEQFACTYLHNLEEAHATFSMNIKSRFRATRVAIVQYDAGRFYPEVSVYCYHMSATVTLYSAVDKDLRVEMSCTILNYCNVCCSETTLMFIPLSICKCMYYI